MKQIQKKLSEISVIMTAAQDLLQRVYDLLHDGVYDSEPFGHLNIDYADADKLEAEIDNFLRSLKEDY